MCGGKGDRSRLSGEGCGKVRHERDGVGDTDA